MNGFLSELKRRNVIRMAGLYLVGAWLLIQVASTVLPAFNVPSWALRTLIIVMVAGFIPAMIFAWVFELTPDGLKRDAEVTPDDSIAPQTAKKLNRLIIAGLVLVISLMAIERFWFVPKEMAMSNNVEATQAASAPINSIAVLPFQNKNSDADTEYLSDGLAESLIYRLAQLPNLKVSPSSSIFRYKGKDIDPIKVAAELGVSAVMTGRLVQRGDDLSISVELLDVRNNKLLWGEQYNRKMSELLATQREIAVEITNKLQLKLSDEGQQKLAKKYTESTEAYQAYLKGRYYWNKRDEANIRKAIVQFKAAADIDPNYALAYVGLADCYVLLPYYSNVNSNEVLPHARIYVNRALEIDDTLGEAHATLGYVNMNAWDWAEAEKSFRKAVELKPGYATAHQWFGLYLLTVGRYEESVLELKRANALEPLSIAISNNLVEVYTLTGNLNAAAEQSQRAFELDPNWYFARFTRAILLLEMGRNAEAIAEADKSVALSNRQNVPLGVLGYVYAKTGRQADALKVVAELKERYQKLQIGGLDIARVYGGLDDKDQAFDWLEKEFQSRNQKLPIWLALVYFDPLRDDPRYKDLLKRMGLPLENSKP